MTRMMYSVLPIGRLTGKISEQRELSAEARRICHISAGVTVSVGLIKVVNSAETRSTPVVTIQKIFASCLIRYLNICSSLFCYRRYKPNFSFRSGTYCRETMRCSPFFIQTSKRPLTPGLMLRTFARLMIVDLEARKKSVCRRRSSSS